MNPTAKRLIDANELRSKAYSAMLEIANTPLPNEYSSKLALKMGEMFQKLIDDEPTVEDAVSLGVIEQFKWERDTAVAQLEELGIGFGQKKPDMVDVVRCKDCINRDQAFRCIALYYGFNPHDDWFCANGKRDAEVEGCLT